MTLRRSNTHGMNTLVCPHCLNVIPQAASVCTGCGAEIVRGATRRERGSAGCATALLLVVTTFAVAGLRPLPPPGSDEGLLLITEFLAVALVGNLIGCWLMRRFRRRFDTLLPRLPARLRLIAPSQQPPLLFARLLRRLPVVEVGEGSVALEVLALTLQADGRSGKSRTSRSARNEQIWEREPPGLPKGVTIRNTAPLGAFLNASVPDIYVVGLAGFEPAASSSRTKRSTKLSHSPCGDGSMARSRTPSIEIEGSRQKSVGFERALL